MHMLLRLLLYSHYVNLTKDLLHPLILSCIAMVIDVPQPCLCCHSVSSLVLSIFADGRVPCYALVGIYVTPCSADVLGRKYIMIVDASGGVPSPSRSTTWLSGHVNSPILRDTPAAGCLASRECHWVAQLRRTVKWYCLW